MQRTDRVQPPDPQPYADDARPPDARAPIAVVGGGAVGSFLASLLDRGGERVVLVEQPGSGVRRVEIRLRDPSGSVRTTVLEQVDDPAAVQPAPAIVVFAVRMPDLAGALRASAVAWPSATFVTVENGLGAEELARAARPGGPLAAGSLTAPIEREAEGGLAWRRRRGIALARVEGETSAAIGRLAGALGRGGLPAPELPDWRSMKWSKLLSNLAANATCAVLDLDPAAVYADRRLFAVERAQLLEALGVMRALGLRPVPLPGADIRLFALGYRAPPVLAWPILRVVLGGARGGKLPSLALHVRAAHAGTMGAATEAPWLNGGVAAAAAAAGLRAPVNAALAAMVEDAAASRERREVLRDRRTFLQTIDQAVASAREP